MLTRPNLDALLTRYGAMAEAARANDWDRLAALEREAAALRDAARLGADAAAHIASPGALPPDEAAALRTSIERILALDAEIRSHTDPFLASVRKLLAGGRQERAVRDAYGALAP
ncbi:MAG TPA: flagellar protein FliT [Thauera sp.]|nr:flagellar protein FliT [Thauera sp.]